jgi:hypothetical protein
MSEQAAQLAQARAARDAARKQFDGRLAQVKQDLAARGVGGRIADQFTSDTMSALQQSLRIAEAEKGIVAGTIAALALWFLRHPIIDWLGNALGFENKEPDSE